MTSRDYGHVPGINNRATDAKWTVTHDGGTTTVTVNQEQNGGQWVPLGVYDLSTGTGDLVSVTVEADEMVTADAVMFIKAVDEPRVFADAIKIVPNTAEDALYVHADHLARPQKMTDEDGSVVWDAAFRPFGEVDGISGTETSNLRFPGQYADIESALAYNWHRHYDPTLGRYIQSDPIGLKGGLNTYAYVGGNPVMRVDPDGRNPAAICVTNPAGCAAAARAAAQALAAAARAAARVIAACLKFDTEGESEEERCRKVKNKCIEQCADRELPTRDDGFSFFNCVNRCMELAGCR